MCVCLCVCVCVCVCMHVTASVCVCMHMSDCVCVHARVTVSECVCMHAFMVCVHMHVSISTECTGTSISVPRIVCQIRHASKKLKNFHHDKISVWFSSEGAVFCLFFN